MRGLYRFGRRARPALAARTRRSSTVADVRSDTIRVQAARASSVLPIASDASAVHFKQSPMVLAHCQLNSRPDDLVARRDHARMIRELSQVVREQVPHVD